MIYIVPGGTVRNFSHSKLPIAGQAKLFEVLRNCNDVINIPIEESFLKETLVIGKLFDMVDGSKIIFHSFCQFSAVQIKDCNRQRFSLKTGGCGIAECILNEQTDSEKNQNIKKHHSEISLCDCQKSFKYCHNVPS